MKAIIAAGLFMLVSASLFAPTQSIARKSQTRQTFAAVDINMLNPGNGLKPAVPDGVTDNTAAINAALVAAQRADVNVYLPPGTYAHTGEIAIIGHVMLYGAGQSTILKNTAPLVYYKGYGYIQDYGMIFMQDLFTYSGGTITGVISSGPRLQDLSIIWSNSILRGAEPAVGVFGGTNWVTGKWPTTNFQVSGLFIGNRATGATGSGSAGIYVENAANGSIFDNYIYKSLADGINIVDGSKHINVYNNTLELVGDDMISVVSYVPDLAGVCNSINIYNNHGISQTGGRGLAVVGGNYINIANNRVDKTWAAGIYLASEASYNTWAPTNIFVSGNSVNNANSGAPFVQGGVFILGRPGYIANNINIKDNLAINDVNKTGINNLGYSTNITISGNVVNGISN